MGKTELVLPHLDTLETEIDRHGLEDWEPDLALQGLRLVYVGFRDCSREPLNKKAGAVFDRIARMNPAAAYDLCGT
jgi:type VI secretion system protein VasJ